MATFNGIDYIVFILLFLSAAIGIARGFVKEIISLLAWVAAFAVSMLYSVKFAAFLSGLSGYPPETNSIESVPMVAIVISYLALFIGVLIFGSVLKFLVNYLVEGSGLGLANRFLGAVFGVIRGCVIILLALFFLGFTALSTQALWKDSKMVALFHPGVKWLNHLAQPYLSEIEAKMKKTAKKLNQEELNDVIKNKPANALVPANTSPESAQPENELFTKVPIAAPAAPASTPEPTSVPAPASNAAPASESTPTP